MIANKYLVVLLKPSKNIELQVINFQHKLWAIDNTNLMASMSILMWKTWAYFIYKNIEYCKKINIKKYRVF